jgi:polyhydroxybutyrate depolymerase
MVEVAGATRNYRVYIPSSYDGKKPVPLVLALHGGGGAGRGMNRLTKFNDLAERHGFIVANPDGLYRHWNDGRQSGAAESRKVDDVGFLSALIDRLSRDYRIDAKRVYSTGISNGGFMSQRLACELSDKIAAVGVVAATMGRELAGKCNPRRPVSVLLIHGTEDPLVPYEGGRVQVRRGGEIISAPEAVRKWVELNECAATPKTDSLPDAVEDGTRTRREVYAVCNDGTEVVFLAIEGGGHTWPQGPQYLPARRIGRTSQDFNASQVIWEFLAAHPRR